MSNPAASLRQIAELRPVIAGASGVWWITQLRPAEALAKVACGKLSLARAQLGHGPVPVTGMSSERGHPGSRFSQLGL